MNYIPIFHDDIYASGGILLPSTVENSYVFKDVIFPSMILEDDSIQSVKCVVDDDLPVGDIVYGVQYICFTKELFAEFDEEELSKFRCVDVIVCRDDGLVSVSDGHYRMLIPLTKDQELLDSELSEFGELFGKKLIRKYEVDAQLDLQDSVYYCSVGGWIFSEEFYRFLSYRGAKGIVQLID